MKINKIIDEISGIFVPPNKRYYFGKLKHGSPYFYPRNYMSSIIRIRKLKLKTLKEQQKYFKEYTHLIYKKDSKFSNLPFVRRNKEWIIKIFRNYYLIQIGWPFAIVNYGLGWKDKYDTPRFEWTPSFQILFFGIQFCIWWNAPIFDNEEHIDNDLYYEMILWYLYYSDKNIKKAKETWGWIDGETKLSTWNDEYLIKNK